MLLGVLTFNCCGDANNENEDLELSNDSNCLAGSVTFSEIADTSAKLVRVKVIDVLSYEEYGKPEIRTVEKKQQLVQIKRRKVLRFVLARLLLAGLLIGLLTFSGNKVESNNSNSAASDASITFIKAVVSPYSIPRRYIGFGRHIPVRDIN